MRVVTLPLSCLRLLVGEAEIQRLHSKAVRYDTEALTLHADGGGKVGYLASRCGGSIIDEPDPATHAMYTGFDGSALWADLHRAAAPSPLLIATMLGGLKCEACLLHSMILLKRRPPVLQSLDGFRSWSVAFHNDVSAAIGKRPWTLDEAAVAWGWER